MTEFHKVTPDLTDPRQNEFVQDYLTVFNEKYNVGHEDDKDSGAIDSTIEQIQEIYSPIPKPDQFLVELDGMIEATEEFIGDDGLRADDTRIVDLGALIHVRKLWVETFKPADLNDTQTVGRDT